MRDTVFGGPCGETGAPRIPHRIYEVLSNHCLIAPARIACTDGKKAKRGGEVSIMFSRFPCPHFRRRLVPKRTARETASTARVGPLRDPGAKPCCTFAAPRAGVHIIKRQQRQHGPCHVTSVAAHLISIL